MEKEVAKNIIRDFIELNQYKSDWNGQLVGAIETLFGNELENDSQTISNPNHTIEIRFYPDMCDEESCTEYDLETIHTDFKSTNDAIKEGWERIIKTSQICFLDKYDEFIKKGWKVSVYMNGGIVYYVIGVQSYCNVKGMIQSL